MTTKLKARPAITLADFSRAAWPRVSSDPVHVSYLIQGQPHGAKLRGQVLAGMYVALVCPWCGETTESLYAPPGRPGVCCESCLLRSALEDGDDAA